mmetsp:Transcript_39781/g.93565  ORF Transcript_39781/g.93565 Transcript_39781/m.93565 type:complete len:320 (+) Transcript_39781:1567-2526(+)
MSDTIATAGALSDAGIAATSRNSACAKTFARQATTSMMRHSTCATTAIGAASHAKGPSRVCGTDRRESGIGRSARRRSHLGRQCTKVPMTVAESMHGPLPTATRRNQIGACSGAKSAAAGGVARTPPEMRSTSCGQTDLQSTFASRFCASIHVPFQPVSECATSRTHTPSSSMSRSAGAVRPIERSSTAFRLNLPLTIPQRRETETHRPAKVPPGPGFPLPLAPFASCMKSERRARLRWRSNAREASTRSASSHVQDQRRRSMVRHTRRRRSGPRRQRRCGRTSRKATSSTCSSPASHRKKRGPLGVRRRVECEILVLT